MDFRSSPCATQNQYPYIRGAYARLFKPLSLGDRVSLSKSSLTTLYSGRRRKMSGYQYISQEYVDNNFRSIMLTTYRLFTSYAILGCSGEQMDLFASHFWRDRLFHQCYIFMITCWQSPMRCHPFGLQSSPARSSSFSSTDTPSFFILFSVCLARHTFPYRIHRQMESLPCRCIMWCSV